MQPVKAEETETIKQDELKQRVQAALEVIKEDLFKTEKPEVVRTIEKAKTESEMTEAKKVVVDWNKPYEKMSIEELQEAILEKMRKNGPVTEYMQGTVRDNTHQGSLITWVKSFQ